MPNIAALVMNRIIKGLNHWLQWQLRMIRVEMKMAG
jgi:hypothetical protein